MSSFINTQPVNLYNGMDFVNTTERVAYMVYCLMTGSAIGVSEMALKIGLTERSVERSLEKIERVLPVYKDDDRKWKRITW